MTEGTKKLDGKVAIVTGAGTAGEGVGIGKAIAILLAREGAQVALVDVFEDRAQDTLSMIEAEGGEAAVFAADLAQPGACGRVVDDIIARYGGVDILVNSAAITLSASIVDTTDEQYDRMLATNLTAPFMMCRAAIPSMVARGGGSIVNITSVAALRGQGGKGATAYATAKSGMLGLTTDLADAWGKEGIRVNLVAPGIIDTPQRANTIRAAGHDPKDYDLGTKTCLGIEGDPWDIARAVLFLAGPDGRYITGVLLPVDGGTISRSH
jgi:NAD(P)-dependent dehydrogenase (short-subunit alcohol dehydrogenase family)